MHVECLSFQALPEECGWVVAGAIIWVEIASAAKALGKRKGRIAALKTLRQPKSSLSAICKARVARMSSLIAQGLGWKDAGG
jgi:hypothetical protein